MTAATSAARAAHVTAVDARLHKNKDPNPLHTTGALDAAKTVAAPDKDKILIIFCCRIKTNSTRSKSDGIDFSSGSWGKAWDKSDYISGLWFKFFGISNICRTHISWIFNSPEVKDDALATLNVGWEKTEGMSLLR